jgi:hypothetical protein
MHVGISIDLYLFDLHQNVFYMRARRGHDCMVVGFTTTYAIDVYHH